MAKHKIKGIESVFLIMIAMEFASCGANFRESTCEYGHNRSSTSAVYYHTKNENPVAKHISTMQEDINRQQDVEQEIAEEDREAELDLIVQLVAAEAENQDIDGKRLVVDTVLNRVDSNQFPNTIAEVIYQPAAFSSIDDGRFDRAAFEISEEDYQAVTMELSNRLDPYVLYFTAEGYSIYGTPAYKHGDHYFSYK